MSSDAKEHILGTILDYPDSKVFEGWRWSGGDYKDFLPYWIGWVGDGEEGGGGGGSPGNRDKESK